MTPKEFQNEIDRIYMKYCPYPLQVGAIYDINDPNLKEQLQKMKTEVMALKGMSENFKFVAASNTERKIIDFIVNHNKQE